MRHRGIPTSTARRPDPFRQMGSAAAATARRGPYPLRIRYRRVNANVHSVLEQLRMAGGGAFYSLGIFGALFYYWQQANAFCEYVWAVFP